MWNSKSQKTGIPNQQIPRSRRPSYPWRFLPTELHVSQQRRRAVCRRHFRRAAPQRGQSLINN
jgi:hypothetical protein